MPQGLHSDMMAWRCGPAGKLSVGWPVLSLSMTVDSNNQTSSGSGTTSKIDIHIKQAVRAFLSGGAVAGIVITVLIVAFSAAFYIWVSCHRVVPISTRYNADADDRT